VAGSPVAGMRALLASASLPVARWLPMRGSVGLLAAAELSGVFSPHFF